jgi:hypothetical protein
MVLDPVVAKVSEQLPALIVPLQDSPVLAFTETLPPGGPALLVTVNLTVTA